MSKNINEMIEKLMFNLDEEVKPSQKLPIISEGIIKSNGYESEILSSLCEMINKDNTKEGRDATLDSLAKTNPFMPKEDVKNALVDDLKDRDKSHESKTPAEKQRAKNLEKFKKYENNIPHADRVEYEADAYAGRELLYELVKLGEKESVTVMVGAGVHSGNIVQLAKDTEAHAFHMSGKKVLQSGMRYRNERVHMGIEGMSEFEIYRTDAEEIRKATEQLHSIL